MTPQAYARATSCVAGTPLSFAVTGAASPVAFAVVALTSGFVVMPDANATGRL